MNYLVLSILASSLIFVIFKLFDKYSVRTLYAIIINYFIACAVGIYTYEGPLQPKEILGKPWFLGTVFLGIFFIMIFNLMAATSQKIGVSTASVATKMSLAIPVVVGVVVFGEELGLFEVIGVFLALTAVFLATMGKAGSLQGTNILWLPIAVFIGSGIIDASLKYAQEYYVPEEEISLFSALVFGSAFCTGTLFAFTKALRHPARISAKDILGGILLGVPNYFSIYFLMKALDSNILNSASIFTVNNVAIVMLTTLLGIAMFGEQLSYKNWIGIGLAISSIVLVAFGSAIQHAFNF